MSTNQQRHKQGSSGRPPRRPAQTTPSTAEKLKGSEPPVRPTQSIPDEAHLKEVAARLEPSDQRHFRQILAALTEHLGSVEAARLWLVTRAPEFGTTPLTAIIEGKAALVWAVLEARWGPNPIYA